MAAAARDSKGRASRIRHPREVARKRVAQVTPRAPASRRIARAFRAALGTCPAGATMPGRDL